MNVRKVVAPLAAAMLLAAIGVGIWYSNSSVRNDRAGRVAAAADAARRIAVRGLIGSEKEAYFADPRVIATLDRLGITVTVEKAGSRSIASKVDAEKYDFGFPSGAPAGAQLKTLAKASNVYVPFYTPIVIASWRPIADILVSNGIARRENDIYYIVDLPALMAVINEGRRWRDLPGSEAFSTGKAVLLASTDVRTSNSAAMYLALASYVANDQAVVQSQADVDRVLPTVSPLFLRQGFQEGSSAAPFEDYLALGMGKTPMLISYESQLVEFWLKRPERIRGDMVLLYPKPTVYSKHVFVPFNARGDRLGQALERDPELQKLAHEYGFRTGGDSKGPDVWAARGIAVPDTLVDVVDPPSHEWLERMIVAIEQRYR